MRKIALFLLLFQLQLSSKEVTVTDTDNEQRVNLEVGDVVRVNLEGNPTTGYMWEMLSPESPMLSVIEKTFDSSSDRCGAGGVFLFTFRADMVGQSELQFAYLRPWEKEAPPAKVFDVTFLIEESHETL